MTEADLRALEPWFASRRIEPLRPPPDCGDGSVEEELAAADEVVVDRISALCLDLGAGLVPLRPSACACREGLLSSNACALRYSWIVFVNVLKAIMGRALFVCRGAALGCRLFSSTSELSV